jgi:5-methylcytosine-specific restriction enzyme subunit McrC
MRHNVELFEHETVRVGDALRLRGGGTRLFRPEEHDALARFNDVQGGRFFRLGHKSITTTEFVGYVEVGDLAIEILPKADRAPVRSATGKVWRHGLLEMLRAATGLRLENPSPASQVTGRSTLLELIARRFVDEMERLLHEGLAKGYRNEEANGHTFRGKLLFAQQLRENLVRADRFYVRYATFDRDIAVNRILREALDVLGGLALSGGLAARAVACSVTFPEVSRIHVTSETFDRVVLGRSTARYHDALVLARMILEQRAPELRAGQVPVFAVLFDMNILWERYVAALFRRAAGQRFNVSTQQSTLLWRAPGTASRTVRPDIVVRVPGRNDVILVADTKWKVAPDGIPSDDDLKQMFVYNELFDAPRAVLLYPSTGLATGHQGAYAGRPRPSGCPHLCATMHLGVVAEQEWQGEQMQAQIEALLQSVETKPSEVA